MCSWRHTPLFEYENFDDFMKHLPKEVVLVGVESDDSAVDLKIFQHPKEPFIFWAPKILGCHQK